MKKTTRLLAIILALIMCFGALPMSASAATTVDVRADSSKYTYNSSTNTLTLLDGFSAYQQPSVHGDYSAQIYANGNLNIVVNGNCYIFMQSASYNVGYAAGIFCTGRLNISGTGTLNITNSATYPNHSAAGIIALSAISSNISGGQSAVTVGGGVKVNIDVPTARWSYGIIGNLNLNDAKLSITTGNSVYGSRGIHASSWYVDSPSAELTVKCNDTQSGSSLGFYGVLNYRSGNMTVTAQDDVCDGMYNLFHTATVYCNTAPTPSTTLWDKTTNWGDYKYIKVIDNISIATSGVTLNKSSLSIANGSTATLTATVAPSNATNKTVTWESSNLSVATVSDGVVTARAEGTATITVRTFDGGRTAHCAVTVTSPGVPVSSVGLNRTALSLTVGGTSTLTATVLPSNATNKAVTWSSSSLAVASVSSTGVVTAIGVGTTTVTVRTADGNKTASCTVTVTPAQINSVIITDVTAPVRGATASFNYTLPSGAAYFKDTPSYAAWIETDTQPTTYSDLNSGTSYWVDDGSFTFKPDKYYTFRADIRTTNNYAFSSSLTAKINGNTANVEPQGSYHTIWYCFGKTGKIKINAVGVTGVTAPVVGATASFSYNIPSGVSYVKSGTNNAAWVETDTQPTTWAQLQAGTLHDKSAGSFTFNPNKYYTFMARVKADEGYEFSSTCAAVMNSSIAKYSYNAGSGVFVVWYCFGKPATATISSVSVTGVTAPVVGAAASFGYTIPSGAGYVKDSMQTAVWIETDTQPTTYSDLSSGTTYWLSGSVTFKPNKYYTFCANIKESAGYTFSGSLTGTMNGSTAKIQSQSGYKTVWYCFGKPATATISSVSVTGVTAPVTGAAASWNWNIPSSAGYVMDVDSEGGHSAWIETDTQPTTYADLNNGTFYWNNGSSFTFKPDKYYTFRADVKASTGYTFSGSLTGTMNGSTAKIQSQSGFKTIWYCFGKTANITINAVDISGVTAPVVGETASFSYTLPSGAGYVMDTPSYAAWIETDTQPTTYSNLDSGTIHWVEDGGFTFDADKYYTFRADIRVSSGYTFSGSLTAEINGNTAKVEPQGSYHTIWYCFGKTAAEVKNLTSISVTTQPNKKTYTAGESFNKAGMVVKANYSDSTSATITGYTVTNGTNLTTGQTSVTLSYTEGGVTKTATVAITVNAPVKTLTSITVTTQPTKKTYTAGESFNKAGMVVKANYSDSTSATITGYTVTNGTNLTTGQTSVTISYTEGGVTKTATVAITVNAPVKTLSSITVTTQPTKKTYTAGENFAPAGMVVKANYSDSTSATITGYTVTNGTNLTTGQTSVTISYTEGGVTKTATVAITVNAPVKTLSSITVTTQPTKKTYTAGENFAPAGMVVKANYSDSTSATITGYTVTNGTNLTTGQTSVTISYTEGGVTKTATVAITVNSATATLTGIEITSPPTTTQYQYKSSPSTAGMKVTAKYSDNTTQDVTADVGVSGLSTAKKGTFNATVEYEGKTATFSYTVKYAWWQWIIKIVLFGWIWY